MRRRLDQCVGVWDIARWRADGILLHTWNTELGQQKQIVRFILRHSVDVGRLYAVGPEKNVSLYMHRV